MGYLDCREPLSRIKTKDLLIEFSYANGKFSMDTLDGKIIPVVTEKIEFDYRDWNEWFQNFHDFSGFWDYDGRTKNVEVSLESSCTEVTFSIRIWLEEIKLITLEKICKRIDKNLCK